MRIEGLINDISQYTKYGRRRESNLDLIPVRQARYHYIYNPILAPQSTVRTVFQCFRPAVDMVIFDRSELAHQII